MVVPAVTLAQLSYSACSTAKEDCLESPGSPFLHPRLSSGTQPGRCSVSHCPLAASKALQRNPAPPTLSKPAIMAGGGQTPSKHSHDTLGMKRQVYPAHSKTARTSSTGAGQAVGRDASTIQGHRSLTSHTSTEVTLFWVPVRRPGIVEDESQEEKYSWD